MGGYRLMSNITVSDLNLKFFRGRYNIINCGTRTGKTYWAVNNLQKYTRDSKLSRILFLTDTTILKSAIIEQYGESCCETNDFWENGSYTFVSENVNKIGIMCYQALGAKILHDDIDFLKEIDVICWDECDSIFDFAATAFVHARKYDFARSTSTNEEILTIIQQHSSKKEYMPLVLLGEWERIINEQRILCIGLSATPERAIAYYDSLTHAAYQGKLQSGLRAANDIYFKNILEHIKMLTPVDGVAYWCYSPFVNNNVAIAQAAQAQGFNAIEIHSPNNKDWPLTEEQKRVYECIQNLHIVPMEYDFVVITKVGERGIDICDKRFSHLIVDSYYQVDREQAGRQTFPYQRHVKVLTTELPKEFLNRWLTVEDGRALAEYLSVPDLNLNNTNKYQQSRIMTWNKLIQFLPSCGYSVEKTRKRINNKSITAYRITGEWKDTEIVMDNNFMQLVAAKSNKNFVDPSGG